MGAILSRFVKKCSKTGKY